MERHSLPCDCGAARRTAWEIACRRQSKVRDGCAGNLFAEPRLRATSGASRIRRTANQPALFPPRAGLANELPLHSRRSVRRYVSGLRPLPPHPPKTDETLRTTSTTTHTTPIPVPRIHPSSALIPHLLLNVRL